MVTPRAFLSLPIIFSIFQFSSAVPNMVTYNVQSFGAKPDGVTDSTKPFLNAWAAACASINLSMIYVPQGTYLLGPAQFWGHTCKSEITIQIDGTLLAPYDYRVTGNNGCWLAFERVDGVLISGGTLDARGAGLWNCKAAGKYCPKGATTLAFYNSNNVVVNELTSVNSQMFNVIVGGCNNVRFQGMKITTPSNSPNTDGIHIGGSSGVTILNSNISTGDDCVSMGPGTSNVWIENVNCGPGHGISIGSLGSQVQEPGVQNVTVKRVTFRGTDNGVRIKTWAKHSNGYVKDVHFLDVVMDNVRNPILIDQYYCPGQNCPNNQESGVKISGVTYENIRGTSASRVAIAIGCSKATPCDGVTLDDINLSYGINQPAQASCSNAAGTSNGFVQPKGCLLKYF